MSKRINLFFSASVALGIAVAGGCSSSSSNGQPTSDASTGDSSVSDDASEATDGAVHCQIGPEPGCSTGETCCFDPGALASLVNGGGLPDISALTNLTMGVCTTTCTTSFSLGCTSSAACGGQKCCAVATTPPGFADAAADFDGNFAFDGNFGGFDASAIADIDASGGGLVVSCAATCDGPNHLQLCTSASECPSDLICSSGTGLVAMFFGGLKACIPAPEAGVADAGTVDSGSATDGASDGAATVVDAGSDAADSAPAP